MIFASGVFSSSSHLPEAVWLCPNVSITSYVGVLSVLLVTTRVLALTLNCTSFLPPDKRFLQALVSAVNADLPASLSRVPRPFSHTHTCLHT